MLHKLTRTPRLFVLGTVAAGSLLIASLSSVVSAAQTNVNLPPGNSLAIQGCTTRLALTNAVVACEAAPTPVPTTVPTPTPVPVGQPTLLQSWATDSPNFVDMAEPRYTPRGYVDGLVINDETNGAQVVYPSLGVGNGYDYLHLPDRGILRTLTDPNLYQVTTTRAAQMVIVLRAPAAVPAWLTAAGFVDAGVTGDFWCGNSVQCHGFTKTLASATTVNLGGPSISGEQENMYYVLLGEANGTPSVAPAQKGSPAAAANQPCPTWVHDQYVTTGPDGHSYPTWHPQIDPVYWCAFGHEHGSDPALMGIAGFTPAYGYADAAMSMFEAHPGFKSYHVLVGTQEWYFTQHFQTASVAGACNNMHELEIAEKTVGSSSLNVNLNLVADFGVAKGNQTLIRLTPPSCPNQGAGSTSEGERLFVVANDPGGPTFYEPWRTGSMGVALGIGGAITFNTLDPGVMCDSLACQMVSTGLSGSHRYVQPNRQFGVTAGASNTDTFCTDSMASSIVACGPATAVHQLLKVGTNLPWPYSDDNHFVDNPRGNCFTQDYDFVDIHVAGGHVCNLEHELNPNGPEN